MFIWIRNLNCLRLEVAEGSFLWFFSDYYIIFLKNTPK